MKRFLALVFVLAICIPSITSGLSLFSNDTNDTTYISNLDSCENRLIDGVPYVGQETNFYCTYASITTILNYYGANTSLKEVLHHSGIGYFLFYSNLWREFEDNIDSIKYATFFRYPLPGFYLCQFKLNETINLFNLTHNSWKADQNNCSIKSNWSEYWSNVKENITSDNPVMTSVNTLYFPYGDISSGHAIVIVGFNETHIIYNDPATAVLTKPEDGYYANITIDVFQKAVNTTPGTKFSITTFGNTDNINKNRTEVFTKAHKLNMKRLGGYFDDLNPEFLFGINAATIYRKDLRIGLFRRMTTVYRNWNNIHQGEDMSIPFEYISIERHNISQYLLENMELSPDICKFEGDLLEKESKCWKNISDYFEKFQNLSKNNGFLKTWIFSQLTIYRIRKELKKIILIEMAILKGPAKSLSIV